MASSGPQVAWSVLDKEQHDRDRSPVLRAALNDKNNTARIHAVGVLQDLGPAAKDAVPELLLLRIKNRSMADASMADAVLRADIAG